MYRYVFLLIVLTACSQNNTECLERFNQELEIQHTVLLTELTNEFEYLVNMSEGDEYSTKFRNLLGSIKSEDEELFNKYKPKDQTLIKRLAELDTLVFKYDFYNSDDGLKKKYIRTYWDSSFIIALSSVKSCNEQIESYITTIEETGGIGPVLIAERAVLTYGDEDFSNPILKRILAVEILLPYLTEFPERLRL